MSQITESATRFRVVAQLVSCRTGNAIGLGSGGYMSVQVDRGRLLPPDAPVEDIARMLRKGLVEPVGEVPPEVAMAVAVLDAEAEARRPPVSSRTPRDRVTDSLHYAAGGSPDHLHELLDALEQLIDERVAAALEVRADA